MKKLLLMSLVLLICAGCTRMGVESCPAAEEEPGGEVAVSPAEETPIVWQRAPELTVTDGVNRAAALKCTVSWDYEKPDGTRTGINACGSGPLGSRKYMEPLVTDSGLAWLEFELDPDSVTVKCWDAKYFGSYDVEGEPVRVDVLAADFEDGTSTKTYSIHLKEGSWVYEVTAKWERGQYGGTVYYGFYTE